MLGGVDITNDVGHIHLSMPEQFPSQGGNGIILRAFGRYR